MRVNIFKEITSQLRNINIYFLRYFEAFFGKFINIHNENNLPNIFLFSTPRSGSTWLMELILTQVGFKPCNEPLDIRNPMVRRYLGINNWIDLYNNNYLEKIKIYFEKIIKGKLKHLGSNPFDKNFRFITNRIIFKIIHGCEDKINWFKENFNCEIIFLIRHPIAVSLSRRSYPRLTSFIKSDYSKNFSENQINISKRIIRNGSKLERGVLSWCLQNAIPLKNIKDNMLLFTYEQLVSEPKKVFKNFKKILSFIEISKILNRISEPSWSVKKHSNKQTQIFFNRNNNINNKDYLLKKWKKQITREEEKSLFKIIESFNLDIYEVGNEMPKKKYLLK